MGIEYTIIGDNSDVWDTPTDGEFRMYDGGTTLEAMRSAVHAKATISMQEYCTEKTLALYRGAWAGSGRLQPSRSAWRRPTNSCMEISRITGKPIPED